MCFNKINLLQIMTISCNFKLSRYFNLQYDRATTYRPLSVIVQVSHILRYLKLGYAPAIRFNISSLKPVLALKFK